MSLRTGQVGDEKMLRDLRVAALTDSPVSFRSTLQREQGRTVDDWRRWFDPGVTYFWLDDAGAAGGLVAAVVDSDGRSAELASLWVRPDLRGRGVGDALVRAVADWTQERGLPLRLNVVEDNAPAVTLYQRHGFQATGAVDVRPDGVREMRMAHQR